MILDYSHEFADFGDVAYLNTAYEGPLPLAAAAAARRALDLKLRPDQLPYSLHFDLPDRVREKLAQLFAADADDIAITTGASAGLASVAAGVDWQHGDEVLIARGEFPAHFSTWLAYQNAGKLTMKVFAPRGRFVTADNYLEHLTPRTRVVSASYVRFDDGARLDSVRVGEACRANGTFLALDVSQFAGSMPLSLSALGADFVMCSGYKWLLGPYGTGFFWVKRESGEKLPLGATYYTALEGARNVHTLPLTKQQAVAGARRWDTPETASFTNLASMDASLDLLLRTGLDKAACHTAALIKQVVDEMPSDRFTLASPAEPERRGPYVCIKARTPEETAAMQEKLRAAQVHVSLREGALRIAPFIYNSPAHVSRLIDVLRT
jgi:cysteine desulfurase / selenocysteine lyase